MAKIVHDIDNSLTLVYFIIKCFVDLSLGPFIMLASKHNRNNKIIISIIVPPFTPLGWDNSHKKN